MDDPSLARQPRTCPSRTALRPARSVTRRAPTRARYAAIVRSLVAWLPVVGLAGLIFVLSGIRDLHATTGTVDLVLRKGAHFTIYGCLALAALRAVHHHGLRGRRAVGAALLLAVLYAISDELHQSLVPTRDGNPLDVLLDAAGATTALVAATRLAVPWTRPA